MLSEILQELTFTCGHRHVGWPQHNRQRCLDCGGTRFYDLQRGIRGEWISPERPYSEAQLQLAKAAPGKEVAVANIRTTYGSISGVSHTAAHRPATRAVLLAIAILFSCVVPMAGQSFSADREFSMRFLSLWHFFPRHTEMNMPDAMRTMNSTPFASSADFRRIFDEQKDSLHRPSFLLTADREKAEQCFVYGLKDSVTGNPVFKEWACSWAQLAVIKNAAQLINPRPMERSRPSSINSISKALAAESAEIVPILGLEVFERFVYVLSVLEQYSDQECSILLDCTRQDVEAARIRALQQIGMAKEIHLAANLIPAEKQR